MNPDEHGFLAAVFFTVPPGEMAIKKTASDMVSGLDVTAVYSE
jgi:hypothetical protein